jgi:hypothetical protein
MCGVPTVMPYAAAMSACTVMSAAAMMSAAVMSAAVTALGVGQAGRQQQHGQHNSCVLNRPHQCSSVRCHGASPLQRSRPL